MTANSSDRAARRLLFAAIFVSGLAGLMHEIVWAKMLVSLIGSTAHAQVAVLAVFMGGLALGAFVFGRRSDRRDRPLVTYARLEFLIAGYGLLLPWILAAAGKGYEALAPRLFEHGALLFALRFLLSLACVLLPAIWMGGTLPLLARFLVARVDGTRPAVAGLYAINNLGAVLGVGLAGFWTLAAFGILPSLAAAAAMNVLAGFLALRANARASAQVPEAPAESTTSEAHFTPTQYAVTLAALFACGFSAMGYEVLFTRVIALSFGSTTYSFTVMLMSFVTGIGIGSAIVSKLRVERPLWLFGASQLAVAVALLAVTPWVSRLPYWTGLLRIELGTEGAAFTLDQIAKSGMILLVLLVPTVCIGFGFPLVAAIQARSPGRVGGAVGSTYAWNTVGNVCGTVLTGLWLLPALGVVGAFHLELALNVAAGLLVLAVASEVSFARRASIAAVACVVVAAYAWLGQGWIDPINRSVDHLRLRAGPDPHDTPIAKARHASSSFATWQLAYVKRPEQYTRYFFGEDANATVMTWGDAEGVTLTVNTKPDASSFTDPAQSDITTQMLLAHLPMFFARETRSVLVIGHGSGITAGSAMLHEVERGDVVEISRGVLESDTLFAESNHHVLTDPRVRVWQEDGRTFMRTAPWTYDVIVSEPSNPWIAGIAGLFTRECFEEAKARLAPGGVLCVWFHEYEQSDASIQLVLRSIAAVFLHATLFEVLLDGDVVVLASNEPLEPDFARMEARFERPEIRRDLARLHAYDLATLFLFHAIPESRFAELAGSGPINTDDHQRLESMAAKALFHQETSHLVWQHHALLEPAATSEQLLDRYARWRAEQGDPLSKEELESVLRRAQLSLGPELGRPLLDALAVRIAAASPRSKAATRVARGATPALATLASTEAIERGIDRVQAGDVDGALACWRHAASLAETRPLVIANLAFGLNARGAFDAVITGLERALEDAPTSAFLWSLEAQLLDQAGEIPRAKTKYEKVVELDAQDASAWMRLGQICFGEGEVARATECYERALALRPTDWSLAIDLARMLAQVPGGRSRGMQVIQAALRIRPEDPELLRVREAVRGGQ
ncbi:MAG: fused MFS/spermidine synthase [Planctomycetes bacterium]|nr:fused MFS/spermidine synthase [Planctomycetota bacterium]